MELMDLYNQVQNPINNPNVINKLCKAYASSSLSDLYTALTRTVEKEHNKGEINKEDSDYFYSLLFNKWKNSIIDITRERFIKLCEDGSYGTDFIKLRSFLKQIPDVKTKKEADDILLGEYEDEELSKSIKKYSWNALSGSTSWVHVCSRYLTAKKDDYPNVEHRLYLDTESLDTYKMISLFVEKCDKYHLPYYFKFAEKANRDDTVVIYSSTENLIKYVEILKEIKMEHNDLVSKAKEPPILTGRIDDWIGYGSEPERTPDGKNHSFNEIRANFIENAMDKITKKWVIDHRNMQITYKGQKMSFQNYFAIKSTEQLIKRLDNNFVSYREKAKLEAQKTGKPYSENDIALKFGYTLQDTRSPAFKDYIYRYVSSQIGSSLDKVCSEKIPFNSSIVINVRNGRQIIITGLEMLNTIRSLSISISQKYENYSKDIQAAIIENAIKNGVDPNKICFDIRIKEKMMQVDAQNKTVQSSREVQQLPQPNIKTKEDKIEKPEKPQKIDSPQLGLNSFLEKMNPEMLQKKIILPNGYEVSGLQYIQEVIYPQVPENGAVILDNGVIISAEQFIEKYVMYECLEKFGGDFKKYIAERTRNNLGIISIQYDNKSYYIDPVSITNFVNPDLLKKRIKLPTGVEISAIQYIQEVYAPHIPSNGRVILSNGNEISAMQYIEDVLLSEEQAKYNGDIGQILYNTTRQNRGIFDFDQQRFQETVFRLKSQSLEGPDDLSDIYSSKLK